MEVSVSAAAKGAAELLRLRSQFSVSEKSPRDLVTDADLASQEAVHRVLTEAYPRHAFLGEESCDFSQLEEEYCWVVDPLDGTTNYVHGFPFFATSVAVCHRGEVLAGAISDPIRNECFSAGLEHGCWLDGERVKLAGTRSMNEALVAVSFPANAGVDDPDVGGFLRVVPRCRAVRRTGSAALNLAYVATGRLDAHWAFEIFPWDAAAGTLMVHESGGCVTSVTGGAFSIHRPDYLVAGSDRLHAEVLEALRPGGDIA